MVSGEENIYPRELEEILLRHAAIVEGRSRVCGFRVRRDGQSLLGLRKNHVLTKADVVGFCQQYLASYKKPKSVAFVSSLPRNAVGMVLKRFLKQNSNTAG